MFTPPGFPPVKHYRVRIHQQSNFEQNWHRKFLVVEPGDRVPSLQTGAGLITVDHTNRTSPWASTKAEVGCLERVFDAHRNAGLRDARILRCKHRTDKRGRPRPDAWAIFKTESPELAEWSRYRDDASVDLWAARWLPAVQETGTGGVVDISAAAELERRYFTAEQAAEYLGGLNARTVSRWAREGYIPAIPIGEGKRRLWRFLQADLDAWMNSRRCGGELAA